MITKAERSELRTLIRSRFKVLRSDVEARKAELLAQVAGQINARFAAQDKLYNDTIALIQLAADEANRKANDILRSCALYPDYPTRSDHQIMSAAGIGPPRTDRAKLLREGTAQIEAQVKNAYLQLDRQENEVLTELLIGALESDAAKRFLDRIPTVSSLVSADRILALVGPIDVDVE